MRIYRDSGTVRRKNGYRTGFICRLWANSECNSEQQPLTEKKANFERVPIERGWQFVSPAQMTCSWQCAGADCLRGITRLSRRSGSDRSKGGRREHSASHHPCDFLGRVCAGAHRRYWKAVWDGGLTFGLRACVISADVVGGKRGKQDHLGLARHRFGLDSRNKLGRKVSG